MSDFLIYEQEGHIVTLTMNDPERRNPLTGNTAVPEFLEERSWKDCTHRIAGALLFAGSESLQNDVLRHLSFSAALGGRSYAEVLDLMRSLAMAVN